ncbi:hypothetical protein [Parageobacillus thermoglucosidasius]|nr:hypothetical protein [Parageobacillus thermoglucosidasius]MBY6267790.1 hypothetical protein [Parageobacillus thermoglucosidasius]OUM87104.1 MAG: hypothetical protein BAA00_06740 [Parageobacillus thermoglucosidasius]
MDERRREIIVREIEYWKRSRLLPEQYCDYLLTLYTEGEYKKRPSDIVRIRHWGMIRFLLVALICLLLPASVLVIYFTELSFVLQMLLLCLFFSICTVAAWMWKGKGNIIHIPLISGALIFLIASIEIGEYYFPKQKAVTAAIVFMNCFVWIWIGKRFRFLYLLISGMIGIGILAVFLLF